MAAPNRDDDFCLELCRRFNLMRPKFQIDGSTGKSWRCVGHVPDKKALAALLEAVSIVRRKAAGVCESCADYDGYYGSLANAGCLRATGKIEDMALTAEDARKGE